MRPSTTAVATFCATLILAQAAADLACRFDAKANGPGSIAAPGGEQPVITLVADDGPGPEFAVGLASAVLRVAGVGDIRLVKRTDQGARPGLDPQAAGRGSLVVQPSAATPGTTAEWVGDQSSNGAEAVARLG